jgi:hypothetical protein
LPVSVVAVVLVIAGAGMWQQLVGHAEVAKLYPGSCLGGWESPQQAQGKPDVVEDADNYTDANSAVLRNSTASLYCGGFIGDIPKDSEPKDIVLKFRWQFKDEAAIYTIPASAPATSDQPPIIEPVSPESLPIVPQTPAAGDTGTPPETEPATSTAPSPVPTEPVQVQPTSFWDKFINVVWAQTTDEQQVTTDRPPEASDTTLTPRQAPPSGGIAPTPTDPDLTPTSSNQPPTGNFSTEASLEPSGEEVTRLAPLEQYGATDAFLEVRYTTDGSSWATLGKVGRATWQGANFKIPVLPWADISKLQVSVERLTTIDAQPTVYLDTLWLEVEYQNLTPIDELTPEQIQDLPRVEVEGGGIFKFLKTGWRADEEPAFDLNQNELERVGGEQLEAPSTSSGQESGEVPTTEPTVVPSNIPPANSESATTPESSPSEPPAATSGQGQEINNTSSVPESTTSTAPSSEQPTSLEQGPEIRPSSEPTSWLPNVWQFFGVRTALAQAVPSMVRVVKSEVYSPAGDLVGITPTVEPTASGSVRLKLPKAKRAFRPGAYQLRVEFLVGRKVVVASQEFTWGVLALNTNQSVYTPGESAYLQMASLDSAGHTQCQANLQLEITAPSGAVNTIDKTSGALRESPTCGADNVTDEPDYFTHYQLDDVGSYSLKLVDLSTGYEITDQVEVHAEAPFVVSRVGATRINPFKAAYTMHLKVASRDGFKGTVEELVPADFEVTSEAQVSEVDSDSKRLSWTIDLAAGESRDLTYTYQAPLVSPEVFMLGPASMRDPNFIERILGQAGDTVFTETRQWQLASDSMGAGAPTRLWMSGFENNSITAGHEITTTAGTVAISSTTVLSGTYSLRINPTTAAANALYFFNAAADSAVGTYARAYVRFATLPNSNTQVLTFRDNAASNQASIRYDNTNAHFELWNEEDSAQIGSDYGTTITTGTWYRLELYVDFGTAATGDSKVSGRVDGSTFASATNINFANGIRTVAVGPITTTTTQDGFYDDLAVNADSTTSVAGEGFPGEGKIITLRPNGNTGTGFPTGLNCAAADYTCIDEVTPNDATDALQCSAAGARNFNLTDATANGIGVGDSIKVVQTNVRQTTAGTQNSTYNLILNDGSNSDTVQTITIASNATYFTNDDTTPQNPPTTVAATGNVSQGQVAYDKPGTSTDPWTPTLLDSAVAILNTTDCSPVVTVSTIWVNVEYVTGEGGRLWTSGFELQSTTADMEYTANVGSPTISTTAGTFRSGLASLRVNTSAATAGMSYDWQAADSATDTYFRGYFYFSTFPNANTLLMAIRDNAGTNQASIRFDNVNSKLELWNEEDSAQVDVDSAAIETEVWYRVELRVNFGTAATGDTILTAKLDGTQFATSSTVNWANGVRTMQAGIITTNATADVYLDDMAINEGFGSVQNSYPGEGRVVHMQPDSAGDNTGFNVNFSNCAGLSYLCINEVTPSDAGSGANTGAMGSTTLNQIDDFNLESSSAAGINASSTINLLQVGVRFANSAATLSGIKLRLKDAASAVPMESYYIDDTTNATYFTNNESVPRNYMLTAYTRPHLTTAWTTTELDAAQIGFRLGNDGGTNNFGVAAEWLLVEYVPPTITLSGSCKQYDQSTNCTDTGAVKYAINGTLQAEAQPTVGGTWSITAVKPATNDVVTVFINGAGDSNEAVAVTEYDGTSDITTVQLFERHLSIGSVDDQTLSNTNLSQFDNSVSGDEDIFFDVSAGDDLTVDSLGSYTDEELYIASGDTFRPASGGGADVTTMHMELVGIWTADSNNINVAGDWVNSGTFTAGTSTVTLNGAAAQTLTHASQSFNILTINNTGADGTTDDITVGSGTLDVNGNFNITNGDLVLSTNDPSVTAAQNVTISSSAFVTKADNGTATWTFDGAGTFTWSDNTGTNTYGTQQDLGLVIINGAGEWIDLGGSWGVEATTLNIGSGRTLAMGGNSVVLTGTGTGASRPLIVSGTLGLTGCSNSCDFVYLGGGATTSEVENITYDRLIIQPTVAGATYRLGTATSQIITVNNYLLVGDGSATVSLNWTFYDPGITLKGTLDIAANVTWIKSDSATLTWSPTGTKLWIDGCSPYCDVGTISVTGGTSTPTVKISDGYFVAAASVTVDTGHVLDMNGSTTTKLILTGTSGSPLTLSGGSLANTTGSTMEFIGDGSITIAATTYYNLTLDPVITAARDYTAGGAVTVSGALDINPSGSNAGPLTFKLGGTTAVTGTTTVSRTGGTATSALDTTSSNHALTMSSVDIQTGGTLLGNAAVITLTGTSGTLFTRGGTFTQGTSEVKVTSSTGTPTLLSAATTFHKLTIEANATVINMGAFTLTINNAANAQLYVKTGVFNASGADITGPGAGNGTLQIDNGATLCLGGTTTSTNNTCNSGASDTTARTMPTFQTYTFGTTSTVSYLSDASTSVSSSPNYGNLKLNPVFVTTSRIYTLGGAMTINGNFDINPDESGASTPALTVNGGGHITVGSTKTTTVTRTNSATTSLDLFPVASSYNLTTGGLTIQSGGTLDAGGATSAINIAGNYTNNGIFTAGSSTVTLNGSAQQTLDGTMTGGSAFNNLTITNSSGASPSDCTNTGLTASVILNAALTGNLFTITTQNVRVQYNSGSTYTFADVNWLGAASNLIYFRNSVDSGSWLLRVTANPQTAVSYVNVARSDASSPGSEIQADDGNNVDCNNNNNWKFTTATISYSFSSNTVNLGNLNTLSVASQNHTVTVSTSAVSGYILYVTEDGNLRQGAADINDVSDGTVTAGSEEYGLNTTYDDFSSDAAITGSLKIARQTGTTVTNEVTTCTYKAAVSNQTPTGSYSQVVTYVVVGRF